LSQPTDIVLAGDGYMVVPGTYRRMTDGTAEGAPGSIVQRDFIGGQRRAIQLEAERGWDSEGVGPVLFGQGVEPWPFASAYTDATIATPLSTQPVPAMLLGDTIYVGIGRYLFRSVPVSSPTWSDFTLAADLGSGSIISGLAPYGDKLAVACGATRDIQTYNPSGGTLTTLQAGEKGEGIVGYANQLIWSDATASGTARLRLTTGGGIDSRELDSPIVRMVLHGGEIAIATRTSLYLLGGRPDATNGVWLGEPRPTFTHGTWTDPADFRTMISFGGKLYAWLANALMEWNPNTGSNRQGWRSVGIEGVACFGATVAGGWLIVSLRTAQGTGQLWAYDGTGWWLIENGTFRIWPVSIAGAGTFDLLAFRHASPTYDRYRLVHRDAVATAYRSAGAWRTSLLDASIPNEVKVWRSIQAFFAVPEDRGNTGSTDFVDLEIRYSTDGGKTWTSHVTDSVGGTVGRVYDLGGRITGTLPESRYLQVEIRWSGVTDWAPTLTAIAIDYERLGTVSKRRRWQLGITARDRIVERNGGQHLRSGAQIAADLWTAWSDGITLPFRDLDYDIDPTQRQVRVVGLTETNGAPTHRNEEASSMITVTLIEA
jgi:hypothetical protein